MKAMLTEVAAKMKTNPNANILVVSYTPACYNPKKMVFWKRLEAIKDFLVRKEGIFHERVRTQTEVDGGDYNTVDIKQAD